MNKKIEVFGIWEQINNAGFNPIEFDGLRKQAGLDAQSAEAFWRIGGLP